MRYKNSQQVYKNHQYFSPWIKIQNLSITLHPAQLIQRCRHRSAAAGSFHAPIFFFFFIHRFVGTCGHPAGPMRRAVAWLVMLGGWRGGEIFSLVVLRFCFCQSGLSLSTSLPLSLSPLFLYLSIYLSFHLYLSLSPFLSHSPPPLSLG